MRPITAAAFRLVHTVVLTALVLGLVPFRTAAADERGIRGRVVDQAGAALPNTSVRLRRVAVGLELVASTDDDGRFAFKDLAAGIYSIIVQREGFALASREIEVVRAGARELEVTLEPGALNEEIAVIATTVVGPQESAAKIPGSFDIVDRETLERSRVFNFSEAMRKIAGVNVRDEEGLGLRPNIGIRGLNPTRSSKVLLLEDGIPFTYAPYGDNASYYHPPVERFEQIEVLKGAGQIAYGPTTVGGVVNYITPNPPADSEGSVVLVGGNRNYFNGQFQWGGTFGDTGILFDFMRKQGDGSRDHIHSGLSDATAKIVTALGQRSVLTIKGNYYGERSNVVYSGLTLAEYEENPRANPFINDEFQGDRFGVSASHGFAFTSEAILTTNVYLQRFERDWWRQSSTSSQRPNDAADPSCGGMQNLNTTCGNEGRLRNYTVWGIEPRLNVAHHLFGIRSDAELGFRAHFEMQDRRQENGSLPFSRTGVVVEDNERLTDAFSAFAQNRFVVGRWTVTPGLRVERIFYERTNRLARSGAGVTGTSDITAIVPGIGLAFNATHALTVFGGVHRGFAPPRAEDIINNTTGGAVDLDPELSWNYELGFRGLPFRGVRLDATFFRMDYENQVVPASIAGGVGASFTNGGETLHQGFETTARVDLGTLLGSDHNVYVRSAYTFLPTAEFRERRFSSVVGFADVLVTGNRLPYAPEHLLNATIGYTHASGFDAQLEAVRVSEQFGDDLNTIESSADGQLGLLPAYTVWNATANYDVEAIRSTLFVAVKNLTNDTYIVDRARGIVPGPPRLVQAGVKFRF